MREYRITSWGSLAEQWPKIKTLISELFSSGKKELLITVQNKRRNSLTNAKMHALIGDIRNQAKIELEGAKIPLSCYEFDVVKAFLVRWFDIELREIGEPLRVYGRSVVDPVNGDKMYIRPSTTDFSQKEACKFVEWLYCFGVERGVVFSDPAMKYYEEFLTDRLK